MLSLSTFSGGWTLSCNSHMVKLMHGNPHTNFGGTGSGKLDFQTGEASIESACGIESEKSSQLHSPSGLMSH